MTREVLLESHRAEPFRAFEMLLADGRSVDVANPELCLFTDDDRCVSVFSPPDFSEIVDLALIVSVRHGEAAATKSSEA